MENKRSARRMAQPKKDLLKDELVRAVATIEAQRAEILRLEDEVLRLSGGWWKRLVRASK